MKASLTKTVLAAALLVVLSTLAVAAPPKAPANASSLPLTAQKMIKKHFPNAKIAHIEAKNALLSKSYNVTFTNGYKIAFDRNGDWTKVDCKRSAVPSGLIPKTISEYVKRHHRNAKVNVIEKDRGKYNISLSNGLDVWFDKNFAVIKIK